MKKKKTAISTFDFIQINKNHQISTLKDAEGNIKHGFKQPVIVATIIGLQLSASRKNKNCFISYKHLKKIIGDFSLKTYNLARKKLAKLGYLFKRIGIRWLLSKKLKPLPPQIFMQFLNDNFRFLKFIKPANVVKYDNSPPDENTVELDEITF